MVFTNIMGNVYSMVKDSTMRTTKDEICIVIVANNQALPVSAGKTV